MTERYRCVGNDHRRFFIDFGDSSGTVGKTVIAEESTEGGYAVYWRSQCSIEDFVGYMNDLHKSGRFECGEEFNPHLDYDFMQDGDANTSSPSGKIDETFPTIESMLDYVRQRVDINGRLLRLDTHGGSYIWDDYKMPEFGRTVAIINVEGSPIDNVIALLRLSYPVDEELLTALQKEPPPTTTSPRQ